MCVQNEFVGVFRSIIILIGKDNPALTPIAAGSAGRLVNALAYRHAYATFYRFAAREVQCCDELVGLSSQAIVLDQGLKAGDREREQDDCHGEYDDKLN